MALAYAPVVRALYRPPLRRLRDQAVVVLMQLSVVGEQLAAGQLAEAIGLAFIRHSRAWLSAWRA